MKITILSEKQYKKRLRVIGCSREEIKNSWLNVERRRGVKHKE